MLDPDTMPLPYGIRSRFVDGVNGMRMHVLEAGLRGQPCVLLLHGFPELAYSWRKIMPRLAEAGFHVLAPDQRGYGRTTGWDSNYDGDVDSFRMTNLVRDMLHLLARLGCNCVDVVAGHDFGSSVAAWCGLIRPDIFRRVALMSAPFPGPPALATGATAGSLQAELAKLPRPRKHYQWYYSTRPANEDLWHSPQGLAAFLRGYLHVKSADWLHNTPVPLSGWSAEALAQLPDYYVMDKDRSMAETVAPFSSGTTSWMTDAELAFYVTEYTRTGFQGGLNWYRCRTEGRNDDLEIFAGRRLEVPALYLAGRSDWGMHQSPGALSAMREACSGMGEPRIIDKAGHWVQQECPEPIVTALLDLLAIVH